MPTFEVIPMDQAVQRAGASGRDAILQEYARYVGQVSATQAGKLVPSEGESMMAVRRRLNAAAKHLGKDLTVRREPNAVYFWLREAPRRRGRRPKAEQAGS